MVKIINKLITLQKTILITCFFPRFYEYLVQRKLVLIAPLLDRDKEEQREHEAVKQICCPMTTHLYNGEFLVIHVNDQLVGCQTMQHGTNMTYTMYR